MSSTTGRTHVMMLEPSIKTCSIPVVLIHGDYHTGDIWGPKPDNKPGWAEFFVKSGFTVYILDLPFRARPKPRSSGGKPITQLRAQMVEYHFTAPEKVKNLDWPSAHTHTQWPGTGLRGDPFFERYMRRVVPEFLDRRERQTAGQRALAIFLDKVGPSILIGQGSGANLAWLAADLMPHRVVGIVAIEPAGPPFSQAARIDEQEGRHRYTPKFHYAQNVRQYGIADIPLQFNPPPVQGTFADLLGLDDNDFQPIPNPLRQLPNLRNIPQIIVTGEASPHSLFDWATFKWLKQAGVPVQHIELQHVGLRGNGHLCFLEKNSDEIAGFLLKWMRQNVPAIRQQFNAALEASRTPVQ
ncbi:Alpha/Beta hydrolase protein, partial [Diplogelasinospora grovesii]